MRFIKLYLIFNMIKKKITNLRKRYQNRYHYYCFKKSNGNIGNGVKFGEDVRISGYDSINIGNNVHIGSGTFISGEGGLIIEDNVILSRNIVVYTNSHNYEGGLLPFDSDHINKPVYIGKNVWIGMNVTISPGSKINEGAIIGLGSRVFGEIPPLAIIGTQKPRVIKYRNNEHYRKLEENNCYTKEDGKKL